MLLLDMAKQIVVKKKRPLQTRTARFIALGFLILGVLLGAFDAPGFVDRTVDRTGLRKFIPYHLAETRWHVPFRLGLDIQGGTHLVYQADVSGVPSGDQGSAMESLRDVIERRVNLFGVAEPLVQVENAGGQRQLVVELAGIQDINAAIRLIGETPFLEFREERPEADRNAIVEAQKKKGQRLNEDPYFIPTQLTGRYVQKASVIFDRTTSQAMVGLDLTSEGAKIFGDLTKKNIGKQLAIYLDGAPISAPVVQDEITSGKAQISGNFTPQSAKELAGRMNAGALPVPITLLAQQTVGASLGQQSLDRSLKAAVYGLIAVAIFMLLWYRLPGLIAVIALLLYIGILLAMFKLFPVTVTVAGIAGFVLSIGMAVDANILIFERTKEELAKGKNLQEAVAEGFGRAWTSIRDSNVSSLITASILYWLGTSVVKGFALTLGIGILVSMFSAISVTRTFLFAIMSRHVEKAKGLFMSGLGR